LVHVLELEAGELADDPGARLDLAVELGQCAAHVSGDRRARHRAQELASRRLSVRAGDADQLRLQEAKAQLDLAPDRDATSLGLDNELRLPRDPGALDQYLDAVEQGQITVVADLAVGCGHLHPAPLDCSQGWPPRAR